MTTFEVTPADLHALAGRLSGLLGELESASGAIRSGAAGAAQNAKLEGSIESFLGDWNGGLKSLQHDLSAVAERLAAAGNVYEAAEGEIGSHFGG